RYQNTRSGVKAADHWEIPNNARGHEYQAEVSSGARIEYEESWKGQAQVHRELGVQGQEIKTFDTPVDELYASEPLLLEAAGQVARSNPGAMVLSTTQMFTAGLSYWFISPLGQQPAPGPGNSKGAAALIQRDYDPRPIVLLYDDAQTLLALEFTGGRYQIRRNQSKAK